MTTKKMRLSEARMLFVDRLHDRNLAEATIRAKNSMLRRLLRDLDDVQLASITNTHIEDWIYGLRRDHRTDQHGRNINKGISPATFNQTLTNLRDFFRWAHASGYMRHNPTVNLQMMKVPERLRQRPDPAALLGLLDVTAYPRDRGYLAVAINSALRPSEILRIRVRDVDLDSGLIGVVIQKTGGVDEIPINADLDTELRRWLVAYEAEIQRPFTEDDYLFPATTSPLIKTRIQGRLQHGPRELVPERAARRMEKVVQAALAATGRPTFGEGTHTIRRAVALAYYDEASAEMGDVAALRETAALLHHKNLQTTERYIGMTAEKSRRDKRLKGKPFLTALVDRSNVVPIQSVGGSGA